MTAEESAEMAGWIETERLGLPGGRGDHYVSACGGIRGVLTSHGETAARPITIPAETQNALARSILLFRVPAHLDVAGPASDDMNPGAVRALHELNALAEELES